MTESDFTMNNLKYRNVLITGGAGFIGSRLALKLIEKGLNVTVLDNLSKQIHGENPEKDSPLYRSIKGKVRFINGDVTSHDDWTVALEGQDIVVHLGAETGTGQSMYDISRYVDINVGGTALMLDILANKPHTVKKIVVASSRAVYGEGKYKCKTHGIVYPVARTNANMALGDFTCKCPVCGGEVELLATCENSKLHPTSVYGITKLNQEQLVLAVGESLGIPAVVFRYQNVYGPGQSLSNPYTGILSIFSTRVKNGNDISIFEDGKESRDFVYIDDVVDATILGIEKDEANNNIFNVGTGVQIHVLTVAKTLINKYKIPVEVKITGNYRMGDIRDNYADLSKIEHMLGFKPKVMFDEGISKFVKWVDKQEVREDRYQKSILIMMRKGLYK